MSIIIPDPIVKPYADTGDKVSLPENTSTTVANQETGFPPLQSTPLTSGGVPVNRLQFNGLLNFYTQQIQALVSGWNPTFDQDVSDHNGGYPLGIWLFCPVNNSWQKSLIADNTFNFNSNHSYIDDNVHWSSNFYVHQLNCYNLQASNIVDSLNEINSLEDISSANGNLIATNGYIFGLLGTLGSTIGVSPRPGIVGERISAFQTSPLSTSANTWSALTSIELSAGIWDVSAMVVADGLQVLIINVGTTTSSSGTDPIGYVLGDNAAKYSLDTTTAGTITATIPIIRIVLTSLEPNMYLNWRWSSGAFSSGSTASGRITAVRVA